MSNKQNDMYFNTVNELIDEKKLEFELAEVALVDATSRCRDAGMTDHKIIKIVAKELQNGM